MTEEEIELSATQLVARMDSVKRQAVIDNYSYLRRNPEENKDLLAWIDKVNPDIKKFV